MSPRAARYQLIFQTISISTFWPSFLLSCCDNQWEGVKTSVWVEEVFLNDTLKPEISPKATSLVYECV